MIAECHYPTGGNLDTATASGYNRFHVTQADGLFNDSTSVDIEYDTPKDGAAAASWNPFDERVDAEGVAIPNPSLVPGNRRFRRMTVNGMRV